MVSGRLFSEGLHVLGSAPREPQLAQYLSAFFGDDLPEQVAALFQLRCAPCCAWYIAIGTKSAFRPQEGSSHAAMPDFVLSTTGSLLHAQDRIVAQAVSAVARGDSLEAVR